MTTKTITILGITIFLIILTYLTYPRIKTFFAIDSCLDQGGKWDYKNHNCVQGTEIKSGIQGTSNSARSKNLDFINFPCVVILRPNSQKIEKLQKENSEDDYNTIVDDNEYYMATSLEYLDSVKVRRIEKVSEGSITFKTAQGDVFKIGLDSLYWGILLFNGQAKPVEADITYINQDYESYMMKK